MPTIKAPQSERYQARLWEDRSYVIGEGVYVVCQLRELVCDSVCNVVACGRSGVCSQNNSTVECHSHDRSLRDTSLSVMHVSFDRHAFRHRRFKFLHREKVQNSWAGVLTPMDTSPSLSSASRASACILRCSIFLCLSRIITTTLHVLPLHPVLYLDTNDWCDEGSTPPDAWCLCVKISNECSNRLYLGKN